ncbi:hypothetical protein GCM10023201_32070 [Actinomycetospora corticicola]
MVRPVPARMTGTIGVKTKRPTPIAAANAAAPAATAGPGRGRAATVGVDTVAEPSPQHDYAGVP